MLLTPNCDGSVKNNSKGDIYMKKFYLFGLITALVFTYFSTTFAFGLNGNDAVVFHFNTQTKTLDKQVIPNLGNPDDYLTQIISAGKYAWALNKSGNTVAFYNGAQWSEGIKITGMQRFISLKPGYPISGKMPVAWLLGANGSNFVTAYFNGEKWSNAVSVPVRLGEGLNLVASSGYAWIKSDEHVLIANTQIPLTWVEIKNLPLDSLSQIYSYNDNEIYCYAIGSSNNYSQYGQVLLRIDANGKATIIKTHLESEGALDCRLEVNGNNLLLTQEYSEPMPHIEGLLASNDSGTSWVASHFFFGSDYRPSLNDFYYGKFCTLVNTGGPIGGHKVSCLDTYDPSLSWKDFQVSYVKDQGYSNYTTSFGSLVFTSKDQGASFPYGYKYDLSSGQSTYFDMHIFAHDITANEPKIRAIGKDEIVSCGFDLNDRMAGFYFDGNQWTTIPMEQHGGSCCLSVTGEKKSAISTDKNVWVFPAFGTCNSHD
jgi:hypothetical protein